MAALVGVLGAPRVLDAFRLNQAHLELARVFVRADLEYGEKLALLRSVSESVAAVGDRVASWRVDSLNAADRILAQVVTGADTPAVALEPDYWGERQLPRPIPLTDEVSLLGATVLSDSSHYALSEPLTVALWLQPANRGIPVESIRIDATDVITHVTEYGLVAVCRLENLVDNAGLEQPSLDSRAATGFGSPSSWRAEGEDVVDRVRLMDTVGSLGQCLCITDRARTWTYLCGVAPQTWILYGARYRVVSGDGHVPRLVALTEPDYGVSASLPVDVDVEDGGWLAGYGVAQMPANARASIFLDGASGIGNTICIDNVSLIPLPAVWADM